MNANDKVMAYLIGELSLEQLKAECPEKVAEDCEEELLKWFSHGQYEA